MCPLLNDGRSESARRGALAKVEERGLKYKSLLLINVGFSVGRKLGTVLVVRISAEGGTHHEAAGVKADRERKSGLKTFLIG